MKTKLICFLLCLPFLGVCQFNSSLDVIVGSEFSYRTLSVSDNDLQFIIESRNAEIQKYNWRFGLSYNKQLSEKLYLKTGARFANVGYQRKITGLVYGNQFNGDVFDPNIDPIDPTEISFNYNYLFIEIPVIGRYQFNEKKWSPFVEVGVSPMFLLNHKTEYTLDNGAATNNGNTTNYTTFHLAGNLSLGMNYTPFEKLQFFAQPIFRYHFTPSVDDVPIKENLFNYGIEVGVRRKI